MRFREYKKSEEGREVVATEVTRQVWNLFQVLRNIFKFEKKIIQLKKQDGFTTELFNAKTKNDFDQYVHD